MASRTPAPGALATVQRFVNTADIESRQDELRTPDDLASYLRTEGLLGDDVPLSGEDLRRAIAVRESIRALLEANHGGDVDAAAVATLNEQAGRSGLFLRFGDDGRSALLPRIDGVDAALGRFLAIMYGAMEQGTWAHLKACRRETCRWAFYDHSKNHSSKWCVMEVCGNKEKAKAYRQRHKDHDDHA